MYGQCFLFDMALYSKAGEEPAFSRLPSGDFHRFHWYYPAVRLPVCHQIRFICSLHLPYSFILYGANRLSPVDVTSLCDMISSPTPQQHITPSHIVVICVAFPYFQQVGLLKDSFRHSITHPITLLSTLSKYCYQHPPKTRYQ